MVQSVFGIRISTHLFVFFYLFPRSRVNIVHCNSLVDEAAVAEVTFGGDAHHVLHVLFIYWLFERNVIMAEDIRIAEILPRLSIGMDQVTMPLPVSLDDLLTSVAPTRPLSVDPSVLINPDLHMLTLDMLSKVVGAHGLEFRVVIALAVPHISHQGFFSIYRLYFIIIMI